MTAKKQTKKPAAKKAAPKRAKRAPRTFCTPEVMNSICDKLAEGQSLKSICELEGMPAYSAVRRWEAQNPEFKALSTHAREIGCHKIADECLEIADDARNDWMERRGESDAGWVVNGEHIQRSKLRIETRMRLLGKWLPKVYGDKLALGGAADLPPIQSAAQLTDEQLAAIAAGKAHSADV